MSGNMDIEALRESLAKATPGPWSVKPGTAPESGTDLLVHVGARPGRDTVALQDHCMGFVHRGQDDAALIVASVNALPGLLDRIEELERELDTDDVRIVALEKELRKMLTADAIRTSSWAAEIRALLEVSP